MALGLAVVGIAFLAISGATVILERMGGGLAWGAWLGSHAIGLVILVTVWLLAQRNGQVSLDALGLRRPTTSWPFALALGRRRPCPQHRLHGPLCVAPETRGNRPAGAARTCPVR